MADSCNYVTRDLNTQLNVYIMIFYIQIAWQFLYQVNGPVFETSIKMGLVSFWLGSNNHGGDLELLVKLKSVWTEKINKILGKYLTAFVIDKVRLCNSRVHNIM